MRGLALATLFLGLSLIDPGRDIDFRRGIVFARGVVFFVTLIVIWFGV